jgi:hypothetical protein
MISSFTTNEAKDRFDGFLLGLNPPPTNAEFMARWQPDRFDDYVVEPANENNMLSEGQRKTCIKFLNTLWTMKASVYQEKVAH